MMGSPLNVYDVPSTSVTGSPEYNALQIDEDVNVVSDLPDECNLSATVDKVVSELSISVLRHDADISAEWGFNAFSFIRQSPPRVFFRRVKDPPDREVHASAIFEEHGDTRRRKPHSVLSLATASISSGYGLGPPSKKLKIISETCKVCGESMRERKFLRDRPTFYCSTACIKQKAKNIQKTLGADDEIVLSDKKGFLYAEKLPSVNELEMFLLQKPDYEPRVKVNMSKKLETEASVRRRVKDALQKAFIKRLLFHDVICGHRAKELGYQVEMDLFDVVHDVRDEKYRQWCRIFFQFLNTCGKTFLDKLLDGTVKTVCLTKLYGKHLEDELQRLDVIEEGVVDIPPLSSDETIIEGNGDFNPISFTSEISTKSSLEMPFKLKRDIDTSNQIMELGKSAVDDILGDGIINTTPKHGSHLYDANCDICVMKNQRDAAMHERYGKIKTKRDRELHEVKSLKAINYLSEDDNVMDLASCSRNYDFKHIGTPRERVDADHSFGDDYDDDMPPGVDDYDDCLDNIKPSIRSPSTVVGRRLVSPKSASDREILLSQRPTNMFSHRRILSPSPHMKSLNFSPATPAQRYGSRLNLSSLEDVDHSAIWEKIVWSGSLLCRDVCQYNCDFVLVRNEMAKHLYSEFPETLEVRGKVKSGHVWSYLDTLHDSWNEQVITLLMHPPQNDDEYGQYINFYKLLSEEDCMAVLDMNDCPSIKDAYLFALRPSEKLHTVIDAADGPGLPPGVHKCGNVMALVIRHSVMPSSEKLWMHSANDSSSFESTTVIAENLFNDKISKICTENKFAPPLAPPKKSLPFDASVESPCSPIDDFGLVSEISSTVQNSNALDQLDGLNKIVESISVNTRNTNEQRHLSPSDAAELEEERIRARINDPLSLPPTFEDLLIEIENIKCPGNIITLASAFYNFHTVTDAQRNEVLDTMSRRLLEDSPPQPLCKNPFYTDAKVCGGHLPLPLSKRRLESKLDDVDKNHSRNQSPSFDPRPLSLSRSKLDDKELLNNCSIVHDESAFLPPPPPPPNLDLEKIPSPPPPPPLPLLTSSPSLPPMMGDLSCGRGPYSHLSSERNGHTVHKKERNDFSNGTNFVPLGRPNVLFNSRSNITPDDSIARLLPQPIITRLDVDFSVPVSRSCQPQSRGIPTMSTRFPLPRSGFPKPIIHFSNAPRNNFLRGTPRIFRSASPRIIAPPQRPEGFLNRMPPVYQRFNPRFGSFREPRPLSSHRGFYR